MFRPNLLSLAALTLTREMQIHQQQILAAARTPQPVGIQARHDGNRLIATTGGHNAIHAPTQQNPGPSTAQPPQRP
jgi:hypothetical protein